MAARKMGLKAGLALLALKERHNREGLTEGQRYSTRSYSASGMNTAVKDNGRTDVPWDESPKPSANTP